MVLFAIGGGMMLLWIALGFFSLAIMSDGTARGRALTYFTSAVFFLSSALTFGWAVVQIWTKT